MAQAHDHAGAAILRGVGTDFEIFRQAFFFHDQGVIARGGHRRGKALEDGFAVVLDLAGFAMHQFRGTHDFAAESCADGLMSQADPEQGNFAGKMADQVDADSGFLRRAWSRGKQNALGVHGVDFCHSQLVVPAHYDLRSQFTQILDQVVGKGVVVVENEDHWLQLTAKS